MIETILMELHALANHERALKSERYLKATPGGYGYPDTFLGLTNPQVRAVAKRYRNLPFDQLRQLWTHPVHEIRLCAIFIANEQGKRSPELAAQVYALYCETSAVVNNWDLVDTLGPHVIGNYLYATQQTAEIWRLAHSEALFEQRMAIISQFAWVRAGEPALLYELAEFFLNHPHDLIHKAVGWLLREAGKRDCAALEQFLTQHGAKMPRTMLRYAIERFPEPKRQHYLAIKKAKS